MRSKAADLASLPNTGIQVQLCGDCHFLNFGAYATPERNIIVDINDFDETIPGPWEWDLKRLATSFVLACRGNGVEPEVCRQTAESVACSYRKAMSGFSEMTALDVWYSYMDLATYLAGMKDKRFREDAIAAVKKVKSRSIKEFYFPKMTGEKNGRRLFKDNPPLVYHTDEQREVEFLDVSYADQSEKDHRAFVAAIRSGRLEAYIER